MILTLLFASLLLIILGTIFIFKVKSIVGPKRSFMYKNLNWTINGFIVILFGAALLVNFFTFMIERNYRYKRIIEFNKQIYL
jgi:hypothetical protein